MRPLRLLAPTLLTLTGIFAEEGGQPPIPKPTEADKLVVTTGLEAPFKSDSSVATKLDVPVLETPQSVTALTAELLKNKGAFSMREALRGVSGVTIAAGEGGRTGDSVTIRGFSANTDFYIDGVKDNGQYFRDTFDVERVEVLKGPSSVTFGRGSTGGVINSVTRKPSREWTADANVTAGSYDLKRASVGVGGPLVDDTVAFRLDSFVHDSDSFRNDVHVERWGAAAGVSFQVTDKTELLLQAFRQEEDSTMDYGVPMWYGRPASVPISAYYGFKDDSFQQYDVNRYTATLTHRFSDELTFTNTTRLTEYTRNYRTEILGAVNYTTGTVARTQQLRRNDQTNLFNQTDIRWNGTVGERKVQVVGGVEIGREQYLFKSLASTGVNAVSVFSPMSAPTVGAGRANSLDRFDTRNETKASTVAGYALASIELMPGLTTVLGARVDRFTANYRSGPTTSSPLVTQYQSEDLTFNPRAGIVWLPHEEWSLYASYSTASNPSAETFALNTSTQNLDPEETRSYEIGSKLELFTKKLGLSVAVFRTDKTNLRTVDPSNAAVTVLGGKQRADGIEFEISGQATKELIIFGSVGFLEAKVLRSNTTATDSVTGQIVQVQGRRATNAPTANGSLWAEYTVAEGLTAGLGVTGTRTTFADAANSARNPGYARYDASVGYATRADDVGWTARLNVFNLLDTVYYESAATRYAAPGAPLSAQLSIGASF